MKIYEQEKIDGLEERLSNSRGLVLSSRAALFDNSSAFLLFASKTKLVHDKLYTSLASKEDIDLFKGFSLMVSTGWNANTDVFLPDEIWNARHTPEDKPCNYEHSMDRIIGHITSNIVVDDDYTILEEKPNSSFHIINGFVIYKNLLRDENKDNELKQMVADVLAGIADGTYSVSMECLFPTFDYALKNDKEEYIVARNEKSSFLTKHLIAYGGKGSYEGYNIGRVPRGLVFSGKGFVKNPANPNSIIFRPNISFNGVETTVAKILKTESKKMSEDIKNPELEAALAEIKTLKTQVSEFNAKAHDEALKTLTDELNSVKAKNTELDTALKSSEAKAVSLEDMVKSMKADKDNDAQKFAELTKELDGMKSEARAKVRSDILVKLGYKDKALEDAIAKLSKLTDEDFNSVTSLMPAVNTKSTESETANAAVKALDSVEANKEAPLGSSEKSSAKNEELTKSVYNFIKASRKENKK